jgi:pimeloyl-ACP methyl ester carboxylesterase
MRPRRVARQLWRAAALTGIGLAGGAALVTARHLLTTPQPLASGLPGEGRIDRRHGGDVYYTVAGPTDGRPVVLLHGFYPGASSYEFRAVFARLAETYRVYAPDWLGFGMSERPALTHTGEFYATMLAGFLRDVVGAPAAVVAHGRAGNIAVRAAADAPALFERLALVAPAADAGMRLDPTAGQTVTRLMQKLALGLTPYAIVSLRSALRLAAGRRSAVGPWGVDEQTLDHLYASAHQFGGEHATLSLLTGELDLPIRQIFPLLQTPTLLVTGAHDERRPLEEMERLVALNPRADLEVVSNAGETVYLDQPTLFVHALHRWLGRRIARHDPAGAASMPIITPPAAPPAAPMSDAAPVAPPAAHARPTPPTPSAPEAAPAAKIVPVLEPSATPRDVSSTVPGELHVTRMPDGEAMESAPEPTDTAQPLTLEPITGDVGDIRSVGKGAPDAPGPSARQSEPEGLQQGLGYYYAPEMGAHVMRLDRNAPRSAGRQGTGRGAGRMAPRATNGRHAR